MPNDQLDPAFPEIEGRLRAMLSDGRLVVLDYQGGDENLLRVFNSNGLFDPSFEPISYTDRRGSRIQERGGQLVDKQFGVGVVDRRFHLKSSPRTALQMWGYLDPPNPTFDSTNKSSFRVTLRRLGPTTAPALVHFTTRDLNAIAGKDYVPPSDTQTFAPLEAEKTVSIPILASNGAEFDKTLELAVTSAEGFEALPRLLRLTIPGKLGPAPRLERVKRLRDGRVLLGGFLPPAGKIEFSSDLKTWEPLTNLPGSVNSDSSIWLDASATNASTRFYRAVAR